jgi:hypothetical protein
MRAALSAHDDVLRSAIEAYGGFLFKHTGDGMCAAFSSPKSAVEAATDTQRALELPVRMGIATGEAELRGEGYFGPVLNRAARVMAAGHGGQILLADSTAVLLAGVDFVDLGARRLRDITQPVRVFQVRAEGLRTEFPPLRALDTSPGNLRTPKTSFVGRESDLGEVTAALREHLDYVRPGDTVVVWKLDRLGRNMIHILQTVKELTDRGITLVSTTDGIDSSTAAGRMMIGVLTVFRDRDSCRAISACDNFSDLCSRRISAQSSTVITLQSKGAHFSTGTDSRSTVATKDVADGDYCHYPCVPVRFSVPSYAGHAEFDKGLLMQRSLLVALPHRDRVVG